MNSTNQTLTELACKLQPANIEDNDQFWKMCQKEVIRIIRKKQYSTDDVAVCEDDLSQLILERVFVKLKQFDSSRASFGTWLGHIVDTVCANEFNKGKKRSAESLDSSNEKSEETGASEPATNETNPETHILTKEKISKIRECISNLPESQKKALVLQTQGFKNNEIANAMSKTSQDVSNLLYRARTSLKESIERDTLSMDGYDRVA